MENKRNGRRCRTSPTRSACPRRWCRWCSARRPGRAKRPGPRVFAAADELGYRVNRTAALMTARRSHLIGVMTDIRNSFHAEMVEDIVEAADRAGYEVVLGAVTPTHGESKVIDTLARLPLRGTGSARSGVDRTSCPTLGERLPTVVVGRRVVAPVARRRPRGGRPRDRRGGRPPRRSRAPPDRARDGWIRTRSPRTGATATCVRCDATDSDEDVASSMATSPRTPEWPRRRTLSDCRDCRPRWCAPTTASPSACSTGCAGLGVDVPGEVSVTGLRRQPAGPTRSHRPHLGEPGTARAGQPRGRGGRRASRRRPHRAGVLGAGAAAGGPWHDGCAGQVVTVSRSGPTGTPLSMTTSTVSKVDAGPQKVARRVLVKASAAEVFAIVGDPHRHPELDGSGHRSRRRRQGSPSLGGV